MIGCSVIVPVRNEAGNILLVMESMPVLGEGTEIIFVEGHSADRTWEMLERLCDDYDGPHQVSYHEQDERGKWDAVRIGNSPGTKSRS